MKFGLLDNLIINLAFNSTTKCLTTKIPEKKALHYSIQTVECWSAPAGPVKLLVNWCHVINVKSIHYFCINTNNIKKIIVVWHVWIFSLKNKETLINKKLINISISAPLYDAFQYLEQIVPFVILSKSTHYMMLSNIPLQIVPFVIHL